MGNLTDYNVYCDETSVAKERYLVIGGIWTPRSLDAQVRASLAEVRDTYGLRSEMKWTHVSDRYLEAYKAFTSVFFRYPQLQFNCIVVDKLSVDHRKYNQGDQELGFYKFYFLMLSHNVEVFNRYWIFTDQKSNRDPYRLSDLHRLLNSRRDTIPGQPPVRHLQPLNSKKDDLLQLTDLLLGSVQCHYNGNVSKNAKLGLAGHVASSVGFVTLKVATSRRHTPICIWRWKPGR